MKKKIIYNLNYDLENMKMFPKENDMATDENKYKCVICGQECSLFNSFSNEGHKLICENCYKEVFNSKYKSFHYWRTH